MLYEWVCALTNPGSTSPPPASTTRASERETVPGSATSEMVGPSMRTSAARTTLFATSTTNPPAMAIASPAACSSGTELAFLLLAVKMHSQLIGCCLTSNGARHHQDREDVGNHEQNLVWYVDPKGLGAELERVSKAEQAAGEHGEPRVPPRDDDRCERR